MARYAPSGFYIASGGDPPSHFKFQEGRPSQKISMPYLDAFGNVRIWDTTQKEHPLKIEVKVIAGEIKDIAWDSESKRIIAVGNGQEKCASWTCHFPYFRAHPPLFPFPFPSLSPHLLICQKGSDLPSSLTLAPLLVRSADTPRWSTLATSSPPAPTAPSLSPTI